MVFKFSKDAKKKRKKDRIAKKSRKFASTDCKMLKIVIRS